MRATTVMLLAIALAAIGNWAHNKKFTPSSVVGAIFALIVISLLDNGETHAIATGFAWIFFVAVLLGSNSPLTGLAKINSSSGTKTA